MDKGGDRFWVRGVSGRERLGGNGVGIKCEDPGRYFWVLEGDLG